MTDTKLLGCNVEHSFLFQSKKKTERKVCQYDVTTWGGGPIGGSRSRTRGGVQGIPPFRATLLGLEEKARHRPRSVEVEDSLALGLLRLEAFFVDQPGVTAGRQATMWRVVAQPRRVR